MLLIAHRKCGHDHDMRWVVAVTTLAICAACGASEVQLLEPESAGDVLPVESVGVQPTAASEPASTASPPPTTAPAGESRVISAEGVSLTLVPHASTEVDPYGQPTPPDFVLAEERWFVPDCCRSAVVMQNVGPKFPDEDLVEVQTVDQIEWRIYDIGPRDGSVLSAVAAFGEVHVAVSIEALIWGTPELDNLLQMLGSIDVVAEEGREL